MIRFVVLAGLALAAGSAFAQSGSLYVDAKSNVFGYGVGTPEPGGGGGGVVAPTIALAAGINRTMTFAASGQAGWAGTLFNGPDGGNFSGNTNIPAVGPISGYSGPLSGMLVGVFLESGDISGLTAPGTLSYPDTESYNLTDYSPGLRQVFFIGDGTATSNGSPTGNQTFHVPTGASKLVLGIADAYGFNAAAGYYGDNVGGYDVRYTSSVPEPASLVALIGGAALLLRRRSK